MARVGHPGAGHIVTQIEYRGYKALDQLALEIRKYGNKEIERRARSALRKAAVPLQRAEKQAVKALPSSTRGPRRSLRADIAKATVIQVSMNSRWNGVSVWVNPRRMPKTRKNLGAYMEGTRPFHRWRHPKFGRRDDEWVQQKPKPWFYKTARDKGADRQARKAMDEVVDQIAKELSL